MNTSLVVYIFLIFNLHCGTKAHTFNQVRDKTYLALGDSYTIGESVSYQDSFPYQLASGLTQIGLRTKRPEIIAETGWTSADLIAGLERNKITQKFDIVTLLIGVNNQYRQQSLESYRRELIYLLNKAINQSKKGKSSVFVLSIPDWSVTPFGLKEDTLVISRQIDQFNAVNKKESLRAGVHYIDITPISRLAAKNHKLLARDGLHPSGEMYSEWVKKLIPKVRMELH